MPRFRKQTFATGLDLGCFEPEAACCEAQYPATIVRMITESTKPSGEDIWRRYDSMERRLSTPLSERMLDLGILQSGMKVLDLATGRGEPAIPAAKRVLPDGTVLGVDEDASMLQLARERADREGVTNLELAISNIETLDGVPEHHFDVALARWGLMYLQRPVEALQAVRRALVEGGMMVAAVWTNPDDAVFFQLPRAALSQIAVAPPIDHDLPGTFYYSDLDRLSRDLNAAGFTVQHSETLAVDVMEVSSDDELISWGRAFGMWNLLEALSPAEQSLWEQQLVNLAEPYRSSHGKIRVGGSSLIVVAD